MHQAMTTTAFALEGFRVTKISLFTTLCEKARGKAFDMMVTHAEEVGGNAVIGVRYDATELISGVTEVLSYGTAVVVEKL